MLAAFVLTLALLITVHEYGHFQAARWCGVRILKFSIGFGKPLWSKKFGLDQTEFVIAAIPLGGYVKMLDERELDQTAKPYSEAELSRAFNRQHVLKRMAIVLAGPGANLLLAVCLYCGLFMSGVVGLKPTLAEVAAHSPAAAAGFVAGETLQKVNGSDVATWQEFNWLLLKESLGHASVDVQGLSPQQTLTTHRLSLPDLALENEHKDLAHDLGFVLKAPAVPARIGKIIAGSPADLAGLKVRDVILSVDQQATPTWQDFVAIIRQRAEQPLGIVLVRNGHEQRLSLTPAAHTENGQVVGQIGAALAMDNSLLVNRQYSFSAALLKATAKTWDTAVFSLRMLARMFSGQASWQGVSGPVSIANYAGQSADMGLKVFIGFLALISISIGVLNLLPIPVLDGGHLMYYMLEILTGKPVPESVMVIGQKVGLALLALITMVAFYNDINRLITG